MSNHDPRLELTGTAVERVDPAPSAMTEDPDARLARALTVVGLGIVAGWAAATVAFGWIGLFLPALVAVPVLFVFLFLITWG